MTESAFAFLHCSAFGTDASNAATAIVAPFPKTALFYSSVPYFCGFFYGMVFAIIAVISQVFRPHAAFHTSNEINGMKKTMAFAVFSIFFQQFGIAAAEWTRLQSHFLLLSLNRFSISAITPMLTSTMIASSLAITSTFSPFCRRQSRTASRLLHTDTHKAHIQASLTARMIPSGCHRKPKVRH